MTYRVSGVAPGLVPRSGMVRATNVIGPIYTNLSSRSFYLYK